MKRTVLAVILIVAVIVGGVVWMKRRGGETKPANPVRFFRRISEGQFELKIAGAVKARYEHEDEHRVDGAHLEPDNGLRQGVARLRALLCRGHR